jgi:hypothetical protein
LRLGLTSALFLDDLDILDHGNATALGQLAFYRDGLAALFGELIVDWLVFANHQLGFAVADNTDGPTALDALDSTGLAMLFADRIVIDIAHHIDYFAGDFL